VRKLAPELIKQLTDQFKAKAGLELVQEVVFAGNAILVELRLNGDVLLDAAVEGLGDGFGGLQPIKADQPQINPLHNLTNIPIIRPRLHRIIHQRHDQAEHNKPKEFHHHSIYILIVADAFIVTVADGGQRGSDPVKGAYEFGEDGFIVDAGVDAIDFFHPGFATFTMLHAEVEPPTSEAVDDKSKEDDELGQVYHFLIVLFRSVFQG
jgi:hypothetical protein